MSTVDTVGKVIYDSAWSAQQEAVMINAARHEDMSVDWNSNVGRPFRISKYNRPFKLDIPIYLSYTFLSEKKML